MTKQLDFMKLWLYICAMTGSFLALAAFSAHGFPANHNSNLQLGNGTYLVQSEGEAPEICHSVSKTVEQALEIDPKAIIVMMVRESERKLVIYLSDGTGGIVMNVQSGDIICSSVYLGPVQILIFKTISEDPKAGITTIPVWPQQEE